MADLEIRLIGGPYDGARFLAWTTSNLHLWCDKTDEPPRQIIVGWCVGDQGCWDAQAQSHCRRKHVGWADTDMGPQIPFEHQVTYTRVTITDEAVRYVHGAVDLAKYLDAQRSEPITYA